MKEERRRERMEEEEEWMGLTDREEGVAGTRGK